MCNTVLFLSCIVVQVYVCMIVYSVCINKELALRNLCYMHMNDDDYYLN